MTCRRCGGTLAYRRDTRICCERRGPDVPYVAVPGTWAARQADDPAAWWRASSPLARFLERRGGLVHLRPADPFLWSTDVNGAPALPWPWRKGFEHSDWRACGDYLRHYVPERWPARIIAHSHGAQGVAYAARGGLYIHRLVTVGSPVRADMDPIWRAALPNIGAWRHLWFTSDRMQLFGSVGDRAVRWLREFRYPGVVNTCWPGLDHSEALTRPELFDRWVSQGVVDFLKGA
jgi:hypothetical protein